MGTIVAQAEQTKKGVTNYFINLLSTVFLSAIFFSFLSCHCLPLLLEMQEALSHFWQVKETEAEIAGADTSRAKSHTAAQREIN